MDGEGARTGRRRRPYAHRADPRLPVVFTRAQARQAGMTDRQISRRLAAGVWVPLRHGYFQIAPGADPGLDTPMWQAGALPASRSREVRRIATLLTVLTRDAVASHGSAALLHQLPRPLKDWGPPTVTTPSGSVRVTPSGHVLVAPIADGEIVIIDGLPVTSLARTVADCLRSMQPPDALAIADRAAAAGLTAQQLSQVVQTQAGWPGVNSARQLAALMDGRRESPLESWSAWAFSQHAVPQPAWQADILTSSGQWCGRVDAWWAEGLAGESDGRAKYAVAAAERAGINAEGLADVLHRERQRELAIRRTGAAVVRWGAADVLRPPKASALATYINAERLRLSAGPTFTGSARLR